METQHDDFRMAAARHNHRAGLHFADFDVVRGCLEHGSGIEFEITRAQPGGGRMVASQRAKGACWTVSFTGMGEPCAGGSIQIESAVGRCGGMNRSRITRPESFARYSAGVRYTAARRAPDESTGFQ